MYFKLIAYHNLIMLFKLQNMAETHFVLLNMTAHMEYIYRIDILQIKPSPILNVGFEKQLFSLILV